MDGLPRQLIESVEYTNQFNSLGNPAEIDEAIQALTWAIARNPYEFDSIPGFPHVWIAKTVERVWGTRKIPAVRIWFTIQDRYTVLLRWIEMDGVED